MNKNQRLLIKFSGELFKSQTEALAMEKALDVAREIVKIKKDKDIGVVFGGGNIFRGRSVKELKLNMSTAHYTGMIATLVNALAVKMMFDKLDQPSRIISALQMPQLLGTSSRLDFNKYFSDDEILIFAAGTGNPFVSTDTAAVVRALEINADYLLKATSVKGIYDSDPKQNHLAKQFKKLTYQQYLQIPQAVVLDRTAAVLAQENSLPIYVFKWGSNALKSAIKLKAGGTLIQ